MQNKIIKMSNKGAVFGKKTSTSAVWAQVLADMDITFALNDFNYNAPWLEAPSSKNEFIELAEVIAHEVRRSDAKFIGVLHAVFESFDFINGGGCMGLVVAKKFHENLELFELTIPMAEVEVSRRLIMCNDQAPGLGACSPIEYQQKVLDLISKNYSSLTLKKFAIDYSAAELQRIIATFRKSKMNKVLPGLPHGPLDNALKLMR